MLMDATVKVEEGPAETGQVDVRDKSEGLISDLRGTFVPDNAPSTELRQAPMSDAVLLLTVPALDVIDHPCQCLDIQYESSANTWVVRLGL